jgi:hypothetical protein
MVTAEVTERQAHWRGDNASRLDQYDAIHRRPRRKLETHPKTGAAQLVEIRETVNEIVVRVYVQTEIAAAPQPSAEEKCIFAGMSDDELLGYGVPAEWLNDIKKSTADTVLALTDHLPAEAGGAAQSVVVYLRARSCQAESAPADYARAAVQRTGKRDLPEQERGLRLRGRGRGPGY